MKHGKRMTIWTGIAALLLGAARLTVSQFWLIVHFLRSASILWDAILWIAGLLLLGVGYYLLTWNRQRKCFPGRWELLYKATLSYLYVYLPMLLT